MKKAYGMDKLKKIDEKIDKMKKIPILLTLIFICLPLNATRNSLYVYHTNYPGTTGDYEWLVSDMQNLNSTYPHIFELFTAQSAFGLPNVTKGNEVYKTWIIRITNESTGFNKPEVLFIGGHHGDEKIGVEVAYYLAEWLVTNYQNDSWIRYLVDNREIYIIPLANPYGWVHHIRRAPNIYYPEEGQEFVDMNRDYPYDFDYSGGSSGSPKIFSTVGARAIHELTKRHLFINTVSWHAGTEMIIYAWGCYAHLYNTESPDDMAFYYQGKYMSQYAGPYHGYYQWGRANDLLYPCHGAYEDYAYAMSWDLENADENWTTNGCYSLTHCIEISDSKYPPQSTLGGRNGVYNPGGEEDGYIPKNIRIALLLIDIAQPYIKITNELPEIVNVGEKINFKWKVMGALNTTETNIQYGKSEDPINNYTYATPTLSGGTGWQNVEYSQNITIEEPGDYYFVIRAKVDFNMLQQNNPEPNIPPQSLYVNMRTNDSWNIANENNSLEGRTNWYSEIIHIKVISNHTINLKAGWNLITIPFQNNWTAKTLAENITNCSIISKWNASLQQYQSYLVGISPPEFDFAIKQGIGYFIYVNNDTTFSIIGLPISNVSIPLHIGWNLIGWFKENSTTASLLGQNITNCSIISKWNASLQQFQSYLVGISPPEYDFEIKQGMGIFIYTNEESIWHGC